MGTLYYVAIISGQGQEEGEASEAGRIWIFGYVTERRLLVLAVLS